jgi:hypothetical protein
MVRPSIRLTLGLVAACAPFRALAYSKNLQWEESLRDAQVCWA